MLGTHRLQISKFVEITVLVAEIMTYIKWYQKKYNRLAGYIRPTKAMKHNVKKIV